MKKLLTARILPLVFALFVSAASVFGLAGCSSGNSSETASNDDTEAALTEEAPSAENSADVSTNKSDDLENDFEVPEEFADNSEDDSTGVDEDAYLEDETDAQLHGASYEVATLERVVDGDTLVVNIDGQSCRVRLIGVDTPESVNPDTTKNTEEGQIASDFTKSVLSVGQTLYLVKDTSDTDKYDRLLRYVWTSEPPADPTIDDVASNMLNGYLVAQGYAQAKRYPPDTSFADMFDQLQSEAKSNGKGISSTF